MGRTFTKAEAKESDAKLAALHQARYRAEDRLASATSQVWIVSGAKREYTGRTSFHWVTPSGSRMSFDDAVAAVTRTAENPDTPVWIQRNAREALDRLSDAEYELCKAKGAVLFFSEWENHGRWSRFFVVSGGHIHSSTGCHTLRPTTRIGWLPELSGESEADAVAAHGALLCTVCFPSAPVEWTDGRKGDGAQHCSGQRPVSGSYNPRLYRKYGQCEVCGQTVSVTSTGKVRKHKAA